MVYEASGNIIDNKSQERCKGTTRAAWKFSLSRNLYLRTKMSAFNNMDNFGIRNTQEVRRILLCLMHKICADYIAHCMAEWIAVCTAYDLYIYKLWCMKPVEI